MDNLTELGQAINAIKLSQTNELTVERLEYRLSLIQDLIEQETRYQEALDWATIHNDDPYHH